MSSRNEICHFAHADTGHCELSRSRILGFQFIFTINRYCYYRLRDARYADNERNIPLDFRQSTGRGRKRGKDNSIGWRFERIVIERWGGQGERRVSDKKREREGSSLLWRAAVPLLLLTAGASVGRPQRKTERPRCNPRLRAFFYLNRDEKRHGIR